MRVAPFKRMAHVLSGLAYNRYVGPVVLAVVTGLAAIGFRELVRFFNFILLDAPGPGPGLRRRTAAPRCP